MEPQRMRIVILGLSITSSWGNGHATTFRGLVRELVRRGHDVLFLERDVPWYAANRDMPRPPWGRTELYADLVDLRARFTDDVRDADLVVVGRHQNTFMKRIASAIAPITTIATVKRRVRSTTG